MAEQTWNVVDLNTEVIDFEAIQLYTPTPLEVRGKLLATDVRIFDAMVGDRVDEIPCTIEQTGRYCLTTYHYENAIRYTLQRVG